MIASPLLLTLHLLQAPAQSATCDEQTLATGYQRVTAGLSSRYTEERLADQASEREFDRRIEALAVRGGWSTAQRVKFAADLLEELDAKRDLAEVTHEAVTEPGRRLITFLKTDRAADCEAQRALLQELETYLDDVARRRFERYAAQWTLVFQRMDAVMGADATAQSPTYEFRDEVTGLRITLPDAWERRDPADAAKEFARTNARFHGRPASAANETTPTIFMALARPFTGPDRDRPTLACMTNRAPEGVLARPDDVRAILDGSLQRTFGRHEKGAVITPAEAVDLGGVPAFRATVKAGQGPFEGGTFIALRRGEWFVQCVGVHDAAFRSDVERALGSIRFE